MYVIYMWPEPAWFPKSERGRVNALFSDAITRASGCVARAVGDREPNQVAVKAWVVYVPEGEPEDYDGPVCFEAHAEGWIR